MRDEFLIKDSEYWDSSSIAARARQGILPERSTGRISGLIWNDRCHVGSGSIVEHACERSNRIISEKIMKVRV